MPIVQARQSPPARSEPASVPITPLPASRVSTLVVTGEGNLWVQLSGLPGAVRAKQFDSVRELLREWPGRRAAVVVIDARGEANLQELLQQILTHGGALVPVAIVDEALRVPAAALERQRVLFDHLLLPLDPGTASTILERAAEEAAARLTLTAGDPGLAGAQAAAKAEPGPEPEPTSQAVPESQPEAQPVAELAWIPTVAITPSPSAAPRRSRVPLLLAAGGAAFLLLLGCTLWVLLRSATRATPAAPAATVATVEAPGPQTPAQRATQVTSAAVAPAHTTTAEDLEARLDLARGAMRERRYIDPAEDNALSYYQAALLLDPANGEARQGLGRINELLLARAAAALASRDSAAALRALEAARTLAPGNPRLAALDAQVSARVAELSAPQVLAAMQASAFGRATSLLAQAEKAGTIAPAEVAQLRQEIARRAAAGQIADLVRLVQSRISQGQLVEPAGDSARSYLAALQERAGPGMADEIARLNELYMKRVVSEVRLAIDAQAWSQADVWILELGAHKGSAAQALAFQKEADRLRAPARNAEAAMAAEPVPVEAPTAAARVPVSAAAPAAAAVTPAHLSKPLQLVYPDEAAARRLSGWVQIEAEITVSGRVENARVVDAAPRGLFESVALAAVRRASFAPAVAADGSKQRSTLGLRVQFRLEDKK